MEYLTRDDILARRGGHFGNKCHLDEGSLQKRNKPQLNNNYHEKMYRLTNACLK